MYKGFITEWKLLSDGYGITDVIYKWTYGANKSVKMAPDMTLSQFDLIGIPSGKENKTFPVKGELTRVQE